MSQKTIPENIDPFRYAEQSLSISGLFKIADMPRLNTLVSAGDDTVTADFQFGIDEQKIPFLKGHLESKLKLQCQRCMEPFIYEIISDFALGIVSTLDEAAALPKHYEPVMTKEGSLAIRELVEDELILNLPIIPRHEQNECKVKLPMVDSGWEKSKEQNPFSVLKSLKEKDKQKS